MTLKPYLSAFFWYIFHEKAWDGFCIAAMNASVGLSPVAADAGAEPPGAAVGAAELDVPEDAAAIRIAIGSRAIREFSVRCIYSPPEPLVRKGTRRSRLAL